MRIIDPHTPGRAIEQSQRISEKIKTFPLSSSSRVTQAGNSGTVICISDHARKIQEQNESILRQAMSEGIGARRIFDIRARMDNGFYNSRDVIEKIAEGMMAEASLLT